MAIGDTVEEQEAKAKIELLFDRYYGSSAEIAALAPGRLNLIGEHTDYNEGFVFPVAIDRQVSIAARRTSGLTTLFSAELGEGESFDAARVSPGDVQGWSAYAAGMAWALREHAGTPVSNVEVTLQSDVPIGSGISSSAALELAFGVIWNKLAKLGLSNQDLAKIAQRCENKFVGVQSGIMDQMASAMGKSGRAMFLDTRSLEIQYAHIPGGLTIALCDTGKARELTASAYNERRSQCEAACTALGVKALRDAGLEELEDHRGSMDDVIYRRARHVITENKRCESFVVALDQKNNAEIGRLMRLSHESLRDDYEVSCAELDTMAECAWNAMGCVGARMTGAGFGGACVALVQSDLIADFIAETALSYNRKTNMGGNFLVCEAAEGARTL
jgi:galactokinase